MTSSATEPLAVGCAAADGARPSGVNPSPGDVDGNDWRSLAVASQERFEPRLMVTVVVPFYEAMPELALTLAALSQQSYPRELFEVVVVDDGSAEPLPQPTQAGVDVKVVHQEDLGFGLARARNTGARAASGDVLVFLDCDMMPEQDWLRSHARWHHAASDVLTLGFRAHVDVAGISVSDVLNRPTSLEALFEDRAVDRPDWIEFHMLRTNELTSDADDLFRVVTGGNLGVSRAFFETVGGFDESFTQWGCEDIEFGYRAFTRGAILVPTRDAMCWHQGPGAMPDDQEVASLELQRAKISQLIAHPGFRRDKPGRSFTVPQYLVVVEGADAHPDDVLDTVERVLASDVHDLVVWAAEPTRSAAPHSDASALERFRRLVHGDPRVSIGSAPGSSAAGCAAEPVVSSALDSCPHAAFMVTVRAGASLGPGDIARLKRRLGDGMSAVQRLRDGSTLTIRRTRALHRAKRTGRMPSTARSSVDGAPVSGTAVRSVHVDAEASRMTPGAAPSALDVSMTAVKGSHAVSLGRYRKAASVLSMMLREAMRVRTRTEARRVARSFVGFVTAAMRWRVRWVLWKTRTGMNRSVWAARRAPNNWRAMRRSRRPKSLAGYRLGPAIAALGPRSQAVFAASARVADRVTSSTELIVRDADQPASSASDDGDNAAAVELVLEDLDDTCHVAAFDAEQINPLDVPSRRRVAGAAFGTPIPLLTGVRVRKRVSPGLPLAARRFRFVADAAAYHGNARERASALCEAAAAGALVYIADAAENSCDVANEHPRSSDANQPGLRAMLGHALFEMMTDDRVLTAQGIEAEARSVAMRREALRTHSLRARTRQLAAAAGLQGADLPTVSILLASRRPHQVASACAAVACQKYPRLDLVLALHGDGFDEAEIGRITESVPFDCRTLYMAASEPLGAVLNAAAAESAGTLLTKFDDDDFYGPEHVWDLVLAHEYSRAALVGKAAEFVYLKQSDRTIRRFGGGAERLGSELSLAGGAMLLSRHDLASVGGWQQVPSGVDQALMADMTGSGRRMYRTHGFGYMLVRHGDSHTWGISDEYFLKQAGLAVEGCDLNLAGVTTDRR